MAGVDAVLQKRLVRYVAVRGRRGGDAKHNQQQFRLKDAVKGKHKRQNDAD